MSSGFQRRPHFLLAPFGSAGDVFPFLWLAKGLMERGHRVTLLVPGAFAKAARAEGVRTVSMGSEEDYHSLANDPLLWHPQLGPLRVMRAVRQYFGEYLSIAERFAASERAIILAPSQNFAMRYLAESKGRRLLTVHLQPLMLLSLDDTPSLMAGMDWLRTAPRWLRKWLVHHAPNPVDFCLGGFIRRKCREIGIPAPRRLLTDWWNSPHGVLCLFPEWFAAPCPDWPRPLRMAGFPCFDTNSLHGENSDHPLSVEIRRFLEAGDPPVIFTGGSAMRTGARFFREALGACVQSGRRGIFVARYAEQIPEALPPSVLHATYAPFSALFPKAAAVVHHGGIGTTAQCLAAGVPQIVTPMSHDQPDNARRVVGLGCGVSFPNSKVRASRLAEAIRQTTDSPTIRSRAAEMAGRMSCPGDAITAAVAVEELLGV